MYYKNKIDSMCYEDLIYLGLIKTKTIRNILFKLNNYFVNVSVCYCDIIGIQRNLIKVEISNRDNNIICKFTDFMYGMGILNPLYEDYIGSELFKFTDDILKVYNKIKYTEINDKINISNYFNKYLSILRQDKINKLLYEYRTS